MNIYNQDTTISEISQENNFIFYVYAYLRKDGSPYYIGKGKDNRAFDSRRKNYPNSPNRVVIIESNLSELGAFALERRYIRWYGRKDNGTGILRNLTDGGEGGTGCVISEEHKRKLSVAKKGISFSETHKNNLSISHKGNQQSAKTRLKISESTKGRVVSKETRTKISNKNKLKIRSEEEKLHLSNLNKDKILWNNGLINKSQKECPGEGWVKGKLLTIESRKAISDSKKQENNHMFGKKWYNNGLTSKVLENNPGGEWKLGRLKFW
jgi:hypothetical protein